MVSEDSKAFACASDRALNAESNPGYSSFYWRYYSSQPECPRRWHKLDDEPSQRAVVMDIFAGYTGWGKPFWHVDGLNAARIDSSVSWINDPSQYIREALLPGHDYDGTTHGLRNLMYDMYGFLDADSGNVLNPPLYKYPDDTCLY